MMDTNVLAKLEKIRDFLILPAESPKELEGVFEIQGDPTNLRIVQRKEIRGNCVIEAGHIAHALELMWTDL